MTNHIYLTSNEHNSLITLRDCFAAELISSVYSNYWRDFRNSSELHKSNSELPDDWRICVAECAYEMADAMLQVRNKSNN